MAQVSFEQASKASKGGKFFKVDPDEGKQVRFLIDKWEELEKLCFAAHSVVTTNPDGSKSFDTIDCPRGGGSIPDAECKYCASKNAVVYRVLLPLYNVDEDSVQYWLRSYSWVEKTLKPVIIDTTQGLPSIANQTYKIRRTGTGKDTVYTPVPVMNSADNKTKADFGEIETNPLELNMISKYGESTQSQQAPTQQAPATEYTTRRTTDMF